jgi:hypothetical protein
MTQVRSFFFVVLGRICVSPLWFARMTQYYVKFLDNNLQIPKMGVLHRMTAR